MFDNTLLSITFIISGVMVTEHISDVVVHLILFIGVIEMSSRQMLFE